MQGAGLAFGDEARRRLAGRLARRAVHTRNQVVVYVPRKVYTIFSPFEVNWLMVKRMGFTLTLTPDGKGDGFNRTESDGSVTRLPACVLG